MRKYKYFFKIYNKSSYKFFSRQLNENNKNQFFNETISRKARTKCCSYGQDGKPLESNEILKYMNNLSDKKSKLKWNLNSDYKKLSTTLYFTNIEEISKLIKTIYEVDKFHSINQIPNVFILNKELIIIELFTLPLEGLSHKDFNLAILLNSLVLSKYEVFPLIANYYSPTFFVDYKKEIKLIKTLEMDNMK